MTPFREWARNWRRWCSAADNLPDTSNDGRVWAARHIVWLLRMVANGDEPHVSRCVLTRRGLIREGARMDLLTDRGLDMLAAYRAGWEDGAAQARKVER